MLAVSAAPAAPAQPTSASASTPACTSSASASTAAPTATATATALAPLATLALPLTGEAVGADVAEGRFHGIGLSTSAVLPVGLLAAVPAPLLLAGTATAAIAAIAARSRLALAALAFDVGSTRPTIAIATAAVAAAVGPFALRTLAFTGCVTPGRAR